MKIQYSENGETKSLELVKGEKWSKHKNTSLSSLFNKLDNGNGVIDDVEIDALRREMNVFDSDGKKGNLTKSEQQKLQTLNWDRIRSKVQVAENLYNDVHAKTSIGIPTTGKNISSHVKQVTPDNATTVFKIYNEKTGSKESLVSAIMTEYGLSMDERIGYAKHLVDALARDLKSQGKKIDGTVQALYAELEAQRKSILPASGSKIDKLINDMFAGRNITSSGTEKTEKSNLTTKADAPSRISDLNGKIDRPFSQGKAGDCWLLAAIYALSQTPKGLKILNDSVTILSNGNVQVTLKGVDATYVFTPKEIKSKTNLSTGDLDVRAIEMAMDKYMKEHPQRGHDSINSNLGHVAFKLLTGKGGKNFLSDTLGRILDLFFMDKLIDDFNKPNHVAVVAIHRTGKYSTFKNSNGKQEMIAHYHEYAVKGSDKKNVYLVNPWDTSKTITIPREDFKGIFNWIDEFDL